MLKRLTCFVSGEHHFRVRERDGRVLLECQQCGQRSTGLETGSRPVLGTEPAARPLFGPRKSPLVTPSMGLSHPLLKFSGGSVDDYATIPDDSSSPS